MSVLSWLCTGAHVPLTSPAVRMFYSPHCPTSSYLLPVPHSYMAASLCPPFTTTRTPSSTATPRATPQLPRHAQQTFIAVTAYPQASPTHHWQPPDIHIHPVPTQPPGNLSRGPKFMHTRTHTCVAAVYAHQQQRGSWFWVWAAGLPPLTQPQCEQATSGCQQAWHSRCWLAP